MRRGTDPGRKRRRTSVLFVLIFLALIAVIDYPFIARVLNEREQSAVVMDYQQLSASLGEEEKEKQLAQARAYNETLASGLPADLNAPFAEDAPADDAYQQILTMHEAGAMAVIRIPKIEVSLPVYHGTADEVLEEGAGHVIGSSFPVGGSSTHACIAAHRGLPTKRMFTDLDQLCEGDLFYLDVLGETLAYEVYEVEVVLPDQLDSLQIEAGEDRVTLITCTPYGINTHRIYVHGTRVPYTEAASASRSAEDFVKAYWWIILTIVLLIWMGVLLYVYNKKNVKV